MGRGEVQSCQPRQHLPICFFRPRRLEIVRSQAGFDMPETHGIAGAAELTLSPEEEEALRLALAQDQ